MTEERAVANVVVGVDGNTDGWAALRQAADLAQRLNAHLDVVHIFSIDDLAGMLPASFESAPLLVETPEQRQKAVESAEKLQAEAQKILEDSAVEWVFHARKGEPGRALAELADELDAYCIVVGTRGEGAKAFLERLTHPSVSHAVIRDRHRPVLVVSNQV